MEKGKKDTLLVRLEDNLHLDKKHPTVAIYGKTGSGKATIIKNSLYHMMNFSDPKHLRIAAITSLGSGLEGLNYDNDRNDIKSHNPFMYAPIANTKSVSYTHLTLPTKLEWCRSRWSPYH